MGAEDAPRKREGVTVRAALRSLLREETVTARDISRRIGIREHDVADHLGHLERSLKHSGERLAVHGPLCLDCGFAFPGRRRYTRPGHCPECRSRRVSLPEFRIETSGRG